MARFDMPRYDIIHAADPRYRGGTASALRGELLGAARSGLTIALLPYLGPRSPVVSGFDPRLVGVIAETGTPLLSADAVVGCDILLAHHPNVFERLPDRPIAVRADHVLCVLHHPLVDGAGAAQYDPERVARSLRATYGAPVSFAPIGPVVRAQALAAGIAPGRMLAHDLHNLIDDSEFLPRDRPPPRSHAVLGRHSRSDPLKWPDTEADLLAAYPASPTLEVRVLGDARLPRGMAIPPGWSVRPFVETGVADFLRGLDFYSYFHSRRWVEAFGISVAEALAAGLVTFLPPSFEPLFGPAAVYCQPAEVAGLIAQFMARPDEYARQSRAARHAARARFGLGSHEARTRTLYADLGREAPATLVAERPRPAIPPAPARKRILMVAGNGIGLGHITRLMAIAGHLPAWVQPLFLTLSPGTDLIRAQGFSADYLPSFRKEGSRERDWNRAFAVNLMAAIDASGARMVVFDGNEPFSGMVDVMALRPDIAWVLVRRGLWQPHHVMTPEIASVFDMIIAPGELAHDEDGGATARVTRVEQVAPILRHGPDDRLGRAEAARALGVDPAETIVALQLGSGQNFDLAPLRAAVIAALAGRAVRLIEIANPLSTTAQMIPGDPPRLPVYPLYPLTRAIDLMIVTAGYNSFHECVFGGIPTIFVPNEAPEMDDQALRAAYAQTAGLGLRMRLADAPRAAAILDRALAPEFCARVRDRAALLEFRNGAPEAARLISDFLMSVRTDLPLHALLPRMPPGEASLPIRR